MARESTVTAEQVYEAASKIKNSGDRPTARAVRDILGTGSMATVLKHLQVWQAGQMGIVDKTDEVMDPSVVKAINSQLAQRISQATGHLTSQLADLQSEMNALIQECEQQASIINMRDTEIERLRETNAVTLGQVAQLESTTKQVAADLVTERAAAEAARLALARVELKLEGLTKLDAEIENLRKELVAERDGRIKASELAAVASAKLEMLTNRH